MFKQKTQDILLTEKLYFRLLPVQILLAATSAVNGIVAGLFSANFVGPQAVAAISLYNPVNMFLTAVTILFAAGSQILCGKAMGQNQMERAQNLFSHDLLLTFFVSAVTALFLFAAAAADWTRGMAPDPAVRGAFNAYLMGQAIGIPALLLGQQLSSFLSLENETGLATIAALAYAAVNVLLNVLLVAVLKMGAFGLALASSLGLWVFFFLQARYYFTGRSMLKFRLRLEGLKDGLSILRVGYPGALSNAYQAIRGVIVNALIVSYVGSAGLSAFGASDSVLRIFWAVPIGMTVVSRMLMSVAIGEEDRKTLADVMRVVLFRCLPLMCAISALVMLFAEPLTRLFFRDPADPVYGMTVAAFRILPLCMPFSVAVMNFICYAQASGQGMLVHILSLLDGVVCVAGFSAILMPEMGMNGVYAANVLNGAVCLLAQPVYMRLKKGAFPKNVEQLMGIPEDFGAAEDARIDISLCTEEEVVTVSRQVMEFCEARGIDSRRGYFAGLMLEEMAGNVVTHGFQKDRKSHRVDIRVVHKDADIILRIKDDCVPFNPAERRDMLDPRDPAKNLGIRLVFREARDIAYQNLLGLNVLTLRI